MREILFRGKRVDNGEWVCGYYVYDDSGQLTEKPRADIIRLHEHPCGFSMIPYEVIPETVGQYTGLTDKNGNKIFEGDIVKTNGAVYGCRWAEYNYEFEFANENENYGIAYAQDVEIIGNIHDNPELLKGGETDEE